MRPFLLLAACLAATPAWGQADVSGGGMIALAPIGNPSAATVIAEPVALMIAGFDADGDARVTRAEFEAGLKRGFEAADAAHVGWIGYLAYSDWSERWMGDRNTLPSPFEIDRNGDNRIDWAEFHARFEQVFARFDKDGDSVIARMELVSIQAPASAPLGERKARRR